MWLVIAGWIASALVFSTFFMKTMLPLRLVAIASNVAFMTYALLGLAYGSFGRLYPIFVLHACLLPLNVLRLRQLRRAIAAVSAATGDQVVRAGALPEPREAPGRRDAVPARRGRRPALPPLAGHRHDSRGRSRAL